MQNKSHTHTYPCSPRLLPEKRREKSQLCSELCWRVSSGVGASPYEGSGEKWVAVALAPEHTLWNLLTRSVRYNNQMKLLDRNHESSTLVKCICYTAVLWASHFPISMSQGCTRCSRRKRSSLFFLPKWVHFPRLAAWLSVWSGPSNHCSPAVWESIARAMC